MADVARQVYIISDLHLGGVYEVPEPDPSGRGFRICTHTNDIAALVDRLAQKAAGGAVEIVVNGDMVDFLAERNATEPHWVPYTADPAEAADKLSAIIGRDRQLFDAFGRFLEAGGRLTILLGNHDIELTFPAVRRRLEKEIGVQPHHAYRFIYDGEAYVVGDALIEHGNRYDKWNVVDADALRRVRSLQSRRRPVPDEYRFEPPAGSHMVAEVINPVKEDYRFIDLLKPETAAAVPLLLALEPGKRSVLGKVIKNRVKAQKHAMAAPAEPGYGGDISAEGGSDEFTDDFGGDISATGSPATTGGASEEAAVDALLREQLGDAADAFKAAIEPSGTAGDDGAGDGMGEDFGEDISAMETISFGLGFLQLALSDNNDDLDSRLPALLQAVRQLQSDESFDRSVDNTESLLGKVGPSEYLAAAQDLAATGGFRYVVFGHTHLPKDVEMEGGARYLNSGTWADLIRFKPEILSGKDDTALAALRGFADDLKAGRLTDWIYFKPTYVRFDLGADDTVVTAELCDYDGPDGV